jgi:hypothetical protein
MVADVTVRLTSSQGSWALPDGATVFGRSKSCDICLLDARLSRRHAAFHVRDSTIEIEDLGSTNGLLVNGARLHGRTELAHGDRLVIGPCVITVVVDPTMRPSEALRALTPGAIPARPSGGNDDSDITQTSGPPVPDQDSRGRRIDPAIAAATGNPAADQLGPADHPGPRTPSSAPKRHTTATLRPADLALSSESALDAAHELKATVADDPPLMNPAFVGEPAPHAHAPAPPTDRRLLAGMLDAMQVAAGAIVLSVPPLVAGYVLALRSAGAVLRDGLPRLSYGGGDAASALGIAGSLVRPGGLARAVGMAGELQQHYERLPTLLLLGGVTVATLAFVLTHFLATVVATVLRGAPLWHRRFGLEIVEVRTGAWPGWGRALARWSLLLVLWPFAALTAALRWRGLHDRIAGCAVRSRA